MEARLCSPGVSHLWPLPGQAARRSLVRQPCLRGLLRMLRLFPGPALGAGLPPCPHSGLMSQATASPTPGQAWVPHGGCHHPLPTLATAAARPPPPPAGLPHERVSVSLPLCLHMNLGWDCRSLGPGILMLLTFALRIRGAWGSRDKPCVFFSGRLRGERGYFQGLSSGTGWLYLPWRVATCRVSGCREAPLNSQGRLGAAVCVPLQEDVCVCVRDGVCKNCVCV